VDVNGIEEVFGVELVADTLGEKLECFENQIVVNSLVLF
jgi:hypothetical protein